MDFAGFDWDRGNREKCRRHGVPIDDIEARFEGPLRIPTDVAHSLSEERFKAIGTSRAGRHVLVAFTSRQNEAGLLVQPISARFMHRKEVAWYETETSDLTTDADAEAFVANADFTDYDLSSLVPMRFELKRKDASINLRLPEDLLERALQAPK